ncbi:MAG: hypothetical protein H8E42_01940 [Nitrospinae bacterium]|nr:hypothetical protein [Nitrospinota bacterium]MBL7019710.1 hypothetical protein [Nitrospinaceae bacterium]
MAEDVNFPLDQTRSTSAFQGLREASQESGRPRRVEDQKEDLKNPDKAQEEQEQQSVNKAGSLESRVEISPGARQQAGADPQNPTDRQNQETDIAEAERRELQSNRQEVSEDARTESRNLRSQGPAGANELGRTSEGSVQDPQERLDEESGAGNDLTNPDRIDEFQNGAQIDSVKEAAQQAGEDAVSAEQENLTSQVRDKPTIRDLARDGSAVKDRETFERILAPETPSPDEAARDDLQGNRVAVQDSRIQERVNEEKLAEEADRVRNEPAIDTPSQVVEPVERPVEPIKDGLDTNPLRGPRPSETRDATGSSVETERGQNVSELI